MFSEMTQSQEQKARQARQAEDGVVRLIRLARQTRSRGACVGCSAGSVYSTDLNYRPPGPEVAYRKSCSPGSHERADCSLTRGVDAEGGSTLNTRDRAVRVLPPSASTPRVRLQSALSCEP